MASAALKHVEAITGLHPQTIARWLKRQPVRRATEQQILAALFQSRKGARRKMSQDFSVTLSPAQMAECCRAGCLMGFRAASVMGIAPCASGSTKTMAIA